MKLFSIAICLLLVGIFNSGAIAGQVYTWTDENGNLHVTDTPPPPASKIKDTLEYQEKTAAEIQELENRQQTREKQKHEESIRQQAEKAAKAAAIADEEAQHAAQMAEKEYENAMRTYERYGKTQDNRKKFFRGHQGNAGRPQGVPRQRRRDHRRKRYGENYPRK